MSRAIPSSMDPATVARVEARLSSIKREHDVSIPLAIESGSRAWGFPSPDSDYDCRFIFVRSPDSYLSLFPGRDVIETPLDGELDVNGWDLAKALKLLLKGNAVVIEWLTSPVVYDAVPWFKADMLELAQQTVDRELVARHYLHLGERQRRTYFRDEKAVALKKIFYALRPAAALRWLRLHPDQAVAPMNFPMLLEQCDVPNDVRKLIANLIEQKAVTRELGAGPLPRPIGEFIDAEFAIAVRTLSERSASPSDQSRLAIDNFFKKALSQLAL